MKLHIWVSVCGVCYRAFINGKKPVSLPKHRRDTCVSSPQCNAPEKVTFLQHFAVEVEPQIEKAAELAVESEWKRL